jgi:hypothetical protein
MFDKNMSLCTAQCIMTYIHETFLTIVNFARLKHKLPDDGHSPKHVGAFKLEF